MSKEIESKGGGEEEKKGGKVRGLVWFCRHKTASAPARIFLHPLPPRVGWESQLFSCI